ncbi:MAG: NAD-dependent epimerase/dehydratase family protein [Chloroflexota bacterium]|nr:NAD-dependent epimerase/dehydratase family protein [Chloroflexota bacterium]
MRVLVTGGAGFIGSHIVDALVEQGHAVSVVDNLSEGSLDNLNPYAKFFDVSVNDPDGLELVFAEAKPDVVSHHAAQVSVRNSMYDPTHDAQVNIIGSLNVLQCAVKHDVERIIFPSTSAVYAKPNHLPMDETHPLSPESVYGVSKLSVENFVRLYTDTYGIRHKIFRYGNVFGPRQNPHGEAGVVAIFTGQFMRGEQPTIFGDGGKTRDYIFVNDIVAANTAALDSTGDNETYNIAWGIGVSDFEIFDAVRAASDSSMQPRYAPVRPGEAEHVNLDPSKAIQSLSWRPQVSLYDGILQVIEHYRETH